jgi:hypothetical protein
MTMRGWTKGLVAAAIVTSAATAVPAGAQSAPISGTELAVELEREAARLQMTSEGWADAASLYVAAAGHRQHEDPQARQDLFMAANLYHQVGDLASAISALESAGVRALSAGDSVLAAQMFGNAAQIAAEAGMTNDERRLRVRAADVVYAGQVGAPTRG